MKARADAALAAIDDMKRICGGWREANPAACMAIALDSIAREIRHHLEEWERLTAKVLTVESISGKCLLNDEAGRHLVRLDALGAVVERMVSE